MLPNKQQGKRLMISHVKKEVRTQKYKMRVVKSSKGKGSYIRNNNFLTDKKRDLS